MTGDRKSLAGPAYLAAESMADFVDKCSLIYCLLHGVIDIDKAHFNVKFIHQMLP